MSILWEISIY